MTRDELIALRCVVTLCEDKIKNMSRGQNRLGWTKELRIARKALREITRRFFREMYS